MVSTRGFRKPGGSSKAKIGVLDRADDVEIGSIDATEASLAATSKTLTAAVADERTDRFEPIARPYDRFRREGETAEPVLPGRYIQVHGPDRRLIRLGAEVTHIGRGLAANLRLDDSSVSRRHAVLISQPAGHRILDDRSLNGTFVNGMRVEQSDLRNGDVIAIGRVMLLYLDV
jgi:FHA domain-containing protein